MASSPFFFTIAYTRHCTNLPIFMPKQNWFMKEMRFLFLGWILFAVTGLHAQRVVADCTVTYAISSEDSVADKEVLESLKASTKTVYIKGYESRTDLVSPSFMQSLLYDKSRGTAVILREFGNNKFMTRLDNTRWTAENRKYEGMKLVFNNGVTKTILGYECRKAIINLKDGSSYTLFYTPVMVPSVREFEYQFKDVPGLVLEFESQGTNSKLIKYTATKINLNPVLASKFDIPVSGYRILN